MLRLKVAATLLSGTLVLGMGGAVAATSWSRLNTAPTLTAIKSFVLAGEKLAALPASLSDQLTLMPYDFYSSPPCVVGGGSTIPTHCEFGDKSSKNIVVLDGDSFAGMWFPTLDAIATKHKLKLYLVSRLACPFALVSVSASCKSWQANAATYINSLKPTAIVFASENLSPLQPSQVAISPKQYAVGISSALATFTSPHVRKIVLLGMPTVAFGSPSTPVEPNACIAGHLKSLRSCAIPLVTALIEIRIKDDTAAAKSAGATPVSVTSLFCQTTCPMVVDKNLVFADPFHLNVNYAGILSSALAELIGVRKL
jgi:hypothetical protein